MRMLTVALVTGLLLTCLSGHAAADQEKKKEKQVSCGDIAVATEEAGGSLSADEIAAKLHTSVKRGRECMDKLDTPKKSGSEAGQTGN